MVPVGLAGAGHDQPVGPGTERIDQRRRRLVAGLRAGRDLHRHNVEGPQDVAVGGVARGGQRDPVPRLERRQEGQQEPGRGAGGDHDPIRRQAEAVALAVVLGDSPAQRRNPQGHRVADLLGLQRVPRRLDHPPWGGGRRLADLQVQHVAMGRLALGGGGHDIHHDEWRDLPALGDFQRHRNGPHRVGGPARAAGGGRGQETGKAVRYRADGRISRRTPRHGPAPRREDRRRRCR